MPPQQPQQNAMDLDYYMKFGDQAQQNQPNDFNMPANPIALTRNGLIMPAADRLVVLGIFLDDSGSMSGLERAVQQGLALSVASFRGAKGSDWYLDVRGFRTIYFQGMLKDVTDDTFDGYEPDYGSTPLISHGFRQLDGLHKTAGSYREIGIPTTVGQLLMTDAEPNGEDYKAEDFVEHIRCGDYITGMGIVGESRYSSSFQTLFTRMGIERILTPRSQEAEVRHSFDEFSQSVSAIA